jgi:hypothetical protein
MKLENILSANYTNANNIIKGFLDTMNYLITSRLWDQLYVNAVLGNDIHDRMISINAASMGSDRESRHWVSQPGCTTLLVGKHLATVNPN